jgi:hypothetical protein
MLFVTAEVWVRRRPAGIPTAIVKSSEGTADDKSSKRRTHIR